MIPLLMNLAKWRLRCAKPSYARLTTITTEHRHMTTTSSDSARSASSIQKRMWVPPMKDLDRLKSSNQLKFEMEKLFLDPKVSEKDVDRYITANIRSYDIGSVSELMRLSVKASKVAGFSLLRKHLPVIATSLKKRMSAKWNFKQISFTLYGLQWMDQEDKGSMEIVEIMTKATIDCLGMIAPTEQEVSMSLLGLQHMTHEKAETRKLLLAVASMINRCSEKFIAQTVGNALYSLKGMESDCIEVQVVLKALLPKIAECSQEFSSQNICNSLYGLQGMFSDCKEVRHILEALSPKIKACRQQYTAQELGNAIYGLQGMNSDCIEVRNILRLLNPQVQNLKDKLLPKHVAIILYGMQSMDSDCSEVCNLLSSLTPKIRECKGPFLPQTVSSCLYGLQGMNCVSKEVTSTISALVPLIYTCQEPLDVRHIGNGLYGLQGVGSQPGTSLLMDYLFKQFDQLSTSTSDYNGMKTDELFYLCQILTLTLPEIEQALGGKSDKWKNALTSINTKLVRRRDSEDKFFNPRKIRSNNEQFVHSAASTLFQNSKILMSFNGFLFGLFETDLVLKIPTANRPEGLYLNIELSGIYHERRKRKRFMELRDKYLQSKGVIIERVDILLLRQMEEGELMKWLLSKVTDASRLQSQPQAPLTDKDKIEL